MKLLFITMTPLYHNTSGMMRTYGIISGSVKNGHICDVITMEADKSDYRYDESRKDYILGYINKYFGIKSNKSYSALKEKRKKSILKSFIKKVIKSFFSISNIYDPQVINCGRILELDIDYSLYDRIITVSDPKSSHKFVLKLIRAGKIDNVSSKWIQCWGDPWLIDITKKNTNNRKIKREEKRLIDLAYKVVYTSPFTLEAQKKLYPEYIDKMLCVNQVPLVKDTFITKNFHSQEIGYFGAYNPEIRNINPLYECCNKYGYKAVIAGEDFHLLKSTINVKILGKLSYSEVEDEESKTGVIICLCNKTGTQIPGKIYYQAGYQKPIIVIVDGEYKEKMRKYFDAFNRYIVCENDVNQIKEAIDIALLQIKSQVKYELDERLNDQYCAKKIFGL